MTEFELAILRVLATEPRGLGWYQIELRLFRMLPERPRIVPVLENLRSASLVERT
jgi:hypothetical protein